ncbi:ferredoxin reductase domain-containing protein [Tautonia rosea]|uniref:ferredoxin--NADP(+) reductase n=1 Tax=Tautonia rosea TaxID=2728037 RepID=UPI001476430F|nr:ferredoxin--NADP(+) reductase [Tautonia rosea]
MPRNAPDPSLDIPAPRYQTDDPGVARVVSNERLTPNGSAEIRHLVLDCSGLDYQYREGQSVGIIIPGVEDRGHASTVRFYSIASGRGGEAGQKGLVAICVKRVMVADPITGALRGSPSSEFLCDAKPGDDIAVTGPYGKSFVLPDDPRSNLILAATGTGVSPFRGFLQHLFTERDDWQGQVRLFEGARSVGECLYRTEFAAYQEDHPNFRVHYALSREEHASGGARMYVHHRMEEQIEEVWALLDREETYLYICGIKGMEGHIERVLERRADRDGISWSDFRRVLQDSGRLLIETY